jgi:ankyrin repeat protein
MLAAKEGQLEIVKVLLAAGADPNGKLVSFQFGFETPLMFAIDPCTKNRFAIMDAMIAGGAEVNPTTGGAPPLTYAIGKRDKIMINALIARGADINLTDANGTTPLMSAVLGSDPRMVRFLLAAGADVNARNLKGETALAIARRLKKEFPNSEQDEIIRLLTNAAHRTHKRKISKR